MPDPKPGAPGSRGGSAGKGGDAKLDAYLISGRRDDGVPARFAFLGDREALGRRFVLSEILGTPRALQLRRGPAPSRGRR